MRGWLTVAIQLATIVTTVLALGGTLLLESMAVLTTGDAIGSEEGGWIAAAIPVTSVLGQVLLIGLGCKAAFSGISKWFQKDES